MHRRGAGEGLGLQLTSDIREVDVARRANKSMDAGRPDAKLLRNRNEYTNWRAKQLSASDGDVRSSVRADDVTGHWCLPFRSRRPTATHVSTERH